MDTSRRFVDPATYDRQDAGSFSENLKYYEEEYRPFTSDVIAHLEEPTTLLFIADDNLPCVDAATALLPLASAFVTATYPEEETNNSLTGLEEGRVQIADDPHANTVQANLSRLIDWICGAQGQELVVKSGYSQLHTQ